MPKSKPDFLDDLVCADTVITKHNTETIAKNMDFIEFPLFKMCKDLLSNELRGLFIYHKNADLF